MSKFFIAMLLATTLTGCAEGPFKGLMGKDDRASVYIYRAPGAAAGEYPTSLMIDGKQIGSLVNNGYFLVRLGSGEHVISSPAKNKAELSLYAAKGITYYVSQEVIPSHPPFILLNRVKESLGKLYVARGNRLY